MCAATAACETAGFAAADAALLADRPSQSPAHLTAHPGAPTTAQHPTPGTAAVAMPARTECETQELSSGETAARIAAATLRGAMCAALGETVPPGGLRTYHRTGHPLDLP